MTHSARPISATRMALRTAVILFLFVVIFTALLAGVYLKTRPTVEEAAAEEKMQLIDEVLPRGRYENKLLDDFVDIGPAAALGLDEASKIYRARKGGRIEALVLEAVAPDGYAGKIRLVMALGPDGALVGVRVVQHKETPGLGDYIEPKKDKNKERPWIRQFDGLNPAAADEREWKVKKDGGRFDSMAGATVTPRAVIKAVRKAALYVEENREILFAEAKP